ncbi:substrate-specific component ThiT of thiamin ECF transporter [Lachnospiraceae bacterium KM106-2]|nr:substrate-specific component ThiT of thiamin ECF transporter [Lachnospiraceae bacterium KM106-2]
MFKYFMDWNSDGGSLKTPGYVLFIALIVVFLLIISLVGNKENKRKFSTKQLVFSSICMALAFALSFLKLFEAPMGGSVTLMSTFFVTLIGYLYGPYIGIVSGIAYGFLQLIANPYLVHPLQILVDYPLAFGALGLSGFFSRSKYGMIKGYLFGITGRLFFATLSGVVFFASYAGNMNVLAYSFLYNFFYIAIEGAITVVILCLPVVKNGLVQAKEIATEN